MSDHKTHQATAHTHTHGPNCGHATLKHEGHEDFLHEGHLHHVHGDHVDEHTLAVGAANPGDCTPSHACSGHAKDHTHGAGCGHDAVPHGDHTDYVVDGHLHHPHTSHCDDHGKVSVGA